MDRRSFLKGLIGAGAALILPPTLAENAEEGRRIWALGAIPQPETFTIDVTDWGGVWHVGDLVQFWSPNVGYSRYKILEVVHHESTITLR